MSLLELRQRLAATKQRHQVPSSFFGTRLEAPITLVSTGLAPTTKPQGAKLCVSLFLQGKAATMNGHLIALGLCLCWLHASHLLPSSSLLSCAKEAHQLYFSPFCSAADHCFSLRLVVVRVPATASITFIGRLTCKWCRHPYSS